LVTTKIDMNHNRIRSAEALDEVAVALFPGNRTHQRTFLAIFVELKWSENQFLPSLAFIAEKHSVSQRTMETVRAKMRRLGIIDHVSRFNKRHGYREGWVFSNRFLRSLIRLSELLPKLRTQKPGVQEKRDRDLFRYV